MAYFHSTGYYPYSTNTIVPTPSPFYPSYTTPFYSTNTHITTPLPSFCFNHGYTPPTPTPSSSPNHISPPFPQTPPPSKLEMKLSIFDGSGDAYWWIICSEKSFNSRNRIVSDAEKLMECASAMKGSALTWWLRWYPLHQWVNWDAFTSIFLWQFKPEWRVILPVIEEDLELEPPQLVQGDNVDEKSTLVEERISKFNQHSSSLEIVDLEIADSIEDSLVQSQFSTKTPFNNEHTPLFFEPENQNGDNKIQPYELLTEDLDTVLAVSDEQKDIITTVNNDRDVRLDFDFIFIVPNLVRSSYFTLARFTPTFTAPWMKTTVNMTSITWLQHLVLLFDPGGNFNVQEPNTTNRVPAPPPKPPDRSYYNVSIPCYVQVLSPIPYLLQYGGNFNFYKFCIASSIYKYLHKLRLESHVDALTCYSNEWKNEVYCDSQCLIYLVNFYANVGAQKMFDEMLEQSVFTWLTFIKGFFTSITYGWEVYTSLSLDLCNTYVFYDAHKCCIFFHSIHICSMINCPKGCIFKMPMNYEDNHQVGFLKQSGLNIRTIASTDDLVWVHDHHLLAFSLKHTQSKLIKNVDLMRPLFFAKEAILLVTFFVNVERLTGYYSIGCYDKTMSIMLTLTCSDTLCSNCLRLRSYNNSIVQYYQVHINGLEAHKTNLITILGDYIEALIVQFIKVRYFVHEYLNSNHLDKDACWDIFIGFLEGHCVAELVSWQGLIPSAVSQEYWDYWKNFYNLEDKVGLHGVDGDIIHVVWVSCLLAWVLHNKDIEVEKLRKISHKRISRLWYCYKSDINSSMKILNGMKSLLDWHYSYSTLIVIDAVEGLVYFHYNCVLPIVPNMRCNTVLSGVFEGKVAGTEAAKTVSFASKVVVFFYVTMESYGYIALVKWRKRKKWDPGWNLNMCIASWSSKFKQWDPGKICAKSNFYNLEDKVDFEGVGNVMIL
ncbi:receptor protein kinase HSL1 [Trifolium repens]|nr:receptor protein kinase HSL1 [Trifolium repens]